ncbi:anti-sigma factor RsbA family regulatory protein [Blastococcus sp. SYSU D00820]
MSGTTAEDHAAHGAAPSQVLPPSPFGPRHGAALVGSDDELLAVAVPFLLAGLEAGDLTVLNCPTDTVSLLSDALGEPAQAVEVEPRVSLLGARGPDALAAFEPLLGRAQQGPSGRVRVFCQVAHRDDPEFGRERQRFEQAFNHLVDGAPVSAICAYDSRRVPAECLAGARLTHPHLVSGELWSENADYRDPIDYVRSLPVPRLPLEQAAPVYAIDAAPDLPTLRHGIGAALAQVVADRDEREDLHLAASEIAANAFRHGGRPVSARVWCDGRQLVCTITDGGRGYDDPFAGFQPAHGRDLSRGGMGLWLARKLWDHVDLLPGPGGLTVRLSTVLT